MGVAGQNFAAHGLRPALVASEIALAAPALIAALVYAGSLRTVLGRLDLAARSLVLAALAGGALWLAGLGVLELQYAVWRPPAGYLEAFRHLHELLRPSGPVDWILSVATIALTPAVCEELLFRGVVLPALLAPLRPWGAALGSALLFGLIHLDRTAAGAYSLYRVPFACVVGLGFAALRLSSGSLLPSMLAHAMLNTITFIAAPYTDDPAGGLPDPRPLLGAGLLFAGAAASFAAVRFVRKS
jgi:membrane protease YdiL (CAAX protease family)